MTDRYKNTSGSPRDLDDGRVVAPGEIVEIKKPGPVAQAHIDSEALLPLSTSGSAARSVGGDKSATGGKD